MRSLLVAYVCIWLCSACLIALFMFGLIPQGLWASEEYGDIQYMCSLVSVILTLTFIYLGLKMLFMPKIQIAIKENGFDAYFKYVSIRNFFALVVTVVDLVGYYCTLQSSCGLCWLITMFALFFIIPGKKELQHLKGKNDTVGE